MLKIIQLGSSRTEDFARVEGGGGVRPRAFGGMARK